MKCRSCGYVSFDRLENCRRCGAPRTTTAQGAFAPPAGTDAELGDWDADVEAMIAQTVIFDANDLAWPQDALELEAFVDSPEAPVFSFADDLNVPEPGPQAPATFRDRHTLDHPRGEPRVDPGAGPIIDRDDEIPEQYWATEAAGLGRRAAALGVDGVILAALVVLFFASALSAVALAGYRTAFLLSPAGLWAVARPFALLAALLGLAYHVLFPGWLGATPGQRLAGLEVRCADGQVPSWKRLFLRGCAATLGLACAGIGIGWALFEPRRRGWADLLSGTVVAERRPRDEPQPAFDNLGGRGYHSGLVKSRDSSAGRATD